MSELKTACMNFYDSWHGNNAKDDERIEFARILYDFVRLWQEDVRTPDTTAKVDVRLLNDAITLITKSLAAMLTDTSFASPYVEDHRPRVPSWVMTHFRHDHDRRVEYVNDIKQRLDWIRNATEKVRNEALQAPRSDTSAVELARKLQDSHWLMMDCTKKTHPNLDLSLHEALSKEAEQWLKKVGA